MKIRYDCMSRDKSNIASLPANSINVAVMQSPKRRLSYRDYVHKYQHDVPLRVRHGATGMQEYKFNYIFGKRAHLSLFAWDVVLA